MFHLWGNRAFLQLVSVKGGKLTAPTRTRACDGAASTPRPTVALGRRDVRETNVQEERIRAFYLHEEQKADVYVPRLVVACGEGEDPPFDMAGEGNEAAVLPIVQATERVLPATTNRESR